MNSREELLRTTRGYWEARAILTGVELGVFPAIGRRKLSAASVAKRLSTDPRATGLLLDALAGQGVLVKTGESYAIAPPLVDSLTDGPASSLAMMRHHAALWNNWSRLTDAVRTGKPVQRKSSFQRSPEEAAAFTRAMRDGARRLAPMVAEEVDLSGRRRLLDLGGGPGVYAAAFAERNPELAVTVVDLPNVVAEGSRLARGYGAVRKRVAWHAADITSDPLPEGADAAFLSHVIHGMPEDRIRNLFARVAAALPPKGLFVVRDFFLSPDGTQPAPASLFSLNMLVNTRGGRSYTARETEGWLREAGFRAVRHRRSAAVPDTGYLLARR